MSVTSSPLSYAGPNGGGTFTISLPEAAVDTKGQRQKISLADFAWPEERKFPITTQAQVGSAAKLLGRAKVDDTKRAAIKSRIIRIAKRKGFSLPKAWQTGGSASKTKKQSASEATATLSDDMVRMALSDALRADADPDGDNDDDRISSGYYGDSSGCYCYIVDVFDDHFVYSFTEDDDADDNGLYRRSYSLDANDEAVLGSDISRVVRRVRYDPYQEEPGSGSESMRESWTEASSAMVLVGYEKADGARLGRITGTAIKPGFNKSQRRYYPKETLEAAVAGFVGKKMYIDHPSKWDDHNRPERSVKDIGAVIESAFTQPDGTISYRAIVADPTLDAKLALMSERGILSALGTSVNYAGTARQETIEGIETERIESMDLQSLDFVTEAGAWGDVARMESADDAATASGDAAEENTMGDEVIRGLQEKIDILSTQMTGLVEANREATVRANRAEAAAEVQRCLADSNLPKSWCERIADDFKGRESAEGIADRIIADIALYEEATGKKVAAAGGRESERDRLHRMRGNPARRVVVGNGGNGRETTTEDVPILSEAEIASATDWLMGSGGVGRVMEKYGA